MNKKGSDVEYNSTAHDHEAHIPPILEVPAILHQFLFEEFDDKIENLTVGPNSGWILDHFKHGEEEFINLYPLKDQTKDRYKAIIIDNDRRDIIRQDKSNCNEKAHIPFGKDENGDWIRLD